MQSSNAEATGEQEGALGVLGPADSLLQDISEAYSSWTRRILSIETHLQRNVKNTQKNVSNSLQRQVLDGLIDEQEAREFEYVSDLWMKLHRSYLCKKCGAEFYEEDVLSYLLELFSLGQIGKPFFVNVALELCRTGINNNNIISNNSCNNSINFDSLRETR